MPTEPGWTVDDPYCVGPCIAAWSDSLQDHFAKALASFSGTEAEAITWFLERRCEWLRREINSRLHVGKLDLGVVIKYRSHEYQSPLSRGVNGTLTAYDTRPDGCVYTGRFSLVYPPKKDVAALSTAAFAAHMRAKRT